MKYNRIIVTGDILRPTESMMPVPVVSSQKGNIRWLHALIRRTLSRATGLPVEVIQWGDGFDTENFYALNNEEVSIDGWGRLYDCKDLSADSVFQVAKVFQDSLVIGFELPNTIKNILSHVGIIWLDFTVHPIRCLDDLFLGCATNHEGIRRALMNYEHSFAQHEPNADLLQAMYLREPWPKLPRVDTLFVGQVERDSSVLLDGKFSNIATYIPKNPDLARDVSKWRDILFKPHPVQQYDFGIFDIDIPFRYINVTNSNIYQLLSMPWLKQIITVSSSVGVEAKLFGKEVTWLKGPFKKLSARGASNDDETYFALREEILWAPFWADLLEGLVPVQKISSPRPLIPANAFRLSLNQAWGYPMAQMAASQQSGNG